MTLAERIAVEQFLYWRSIGLRCEEMVDAIGDELSLTPGEEAVDTIEALAWAWSHCAVRGG